MLRIGLQQVQTLSLEQAIEQIEELDREDVTLKVQQLVRKFRIGGIVTKLNVPHGKKDEALLEISVRTGVHVNQMREWARAYKHFGGNEDKLIEFLNSQERPTEYSVRDLISVDSNPAVLGERRFAKRMTNRIQRLAEDMDQFNTLVQKGIVEVEEAEGLMLTLHETMLDYKVLQDAKPETPKSKEYLQAVRQLPCIITGQPGPSDPHHVEVGGYAMKGTDYSVIPLSREIHRLVEDRGHGWMEKKFGVRVGDLVAKTLVKVLTGHDLKLPNDD